MTHRKTTLVQLLDVTGLELFGPNCTRVDEAHVLFKLTVSVDDKVRM